MLFSELLSGISGFSEPMDEPGFSPEQQQALNDDFREFLSDMCVAPYVHLPRKDLEVDAANRGGDRWWTTPTLANSLPSEMLNGAIMSPTIQQSFAVLGGMPLGMIVTEDSAFDPRERIELWREKIAILEVSESLSLPQSILRISSARDFLTLAEAYPLSVTDIPPTNRCSWQQYGYEVAPNWRALSAQCSAVVLSAEAYLEDSWVPLDTCTGRTRISGWTPEVLYLLRPLG